MGCISSDFDGKCNMLDEENADSRPLGCSKNGYCNAEDDPIPSDSCDIYESDWKCNDCYADFNADEECICGDED